MNRLDELKLKRKEVENQLNKLDAAIAEEVNKAQSRPSTRRRSQTASRKARTLARALLHLYQLLDEEPPSLSALKAIAEQQDASHS